MQVASLPPKRSNSLGNTAKEAHSALPSGLLRVELIFQILCAYATTHSEFIHAHVCSRVGAIKLLIEEASLNVLHLAKIVYCLGIEVVVAASEATSLGVIKIASVV